MPANLNEYAGYILPGKVIHYQHPFSNISGY
jgi:hypothetical protein